MLKKLLHKLLQNAGKTYIPDENLSDKLIFSFLYQRLKMLVRGLVFYRKKIFIGSNVKIYNFQNINSGSNVTIEKNCTIDGFASKKLNIGNAVKIGAFSTISTTSHLSKVGIGVSIGNNSAIGEYSYFGASGGISIGNDVIMGQYISFHSENHNFQDPSKLIREQGVSSKGIVIGNNVWVGAKVTFLDGCVVGNNSVVAAGAVVNTIFPDNCVIGGVPAKILKNLE